MDTADPQDSPQPSPALPVAGSLGRIVEAGRPGAVVVTAPPGSGKTMLVPAAVLDDLPAGQVLLLQPRRMAARAVAAQIARLRRGRVGEEVGHIVRFDARVGPATRLIVETTGVTLRRLAGDPFLEGIAAVVLDEFHERSIEIDLVLGMLVRLRATVRPDLRVVVMSATLAADPVARLLAGSVVAVDGRLHPVTVLYEKRGPREELPALVARRVAEALSATDGHVLVFLPGVGEIARCERALHEAGLGRQHEILPLFGDLPPERQDLVLAPASRRRVILSTNVAETSLTIPGVTAVVDSGLARQPVTSPSTGLPRLDLVPVSQASADQRAGRAGRTGPGIAYRLWDEAAHHARPACEIPEVLRGDLATAVLWLAAAGEGEDFPWLDPPPEASVATARRLLDRLGALDDCGCLTSTGRELVRLPAHPRLGRLLLAGASRGALREAAVAAAILSDRDPFRGTSPGSVKAAGPGGTRDRQAVRSRSDLVDRVRLLQAFHAGGLDADAVGLNRGAAHGVLAAADQFHSMVADPGDAAARPLGARAEDPAGALARSLLDAFPDRLVRLRAGSSDRGTMVGGRAARLDRASAVRDEPLLLAIDIDDGAGEARIRSASAVERDWLLDDASGNLARRDAILFNQARRQVEARRQTTWLDLVLDEAPIPISDEAAAAAVLAAEAARSPERSLPSPESRAGSLLARSRWLAERLPESGLPMLDDAALAALLGHVCHGLRSLEEIPKADWWRHLAARIGHDRVRLVDSLAPEQIAIGGRERALDYRSGRPVLAIRIQDLFGIRDTPRIADGRVPVLLQLLGPNGRPQQVTDDLAGFWERTYPRVRGDLRGRYPKHRWPENPLAP
jgi:ATP-dependent helicase HrpB